MLKSICNIFEVSLVIIGTLVGAGFASGKEIYIFFNIYGTFGIIGFFITCIIFSLIIYKVLKLTNIMNISSYSKFLKNINPKNYKIIKEIISTFLLISFYIMVAGISAYFKQKFNIPEIFTSIIMSFICYQILKRNIKGIILLNKFLVPFIIVFIIFLGVKNIDYALDYRFEISKTNLNYFKFIVSSILYSSYNSIILIPIIVELREKIYNRKSTIIVTLITFLILFVLGINIIFIIQSAGKCLQNVELPMVEIVKKFGNINQKLYGIVIIIAILTSAIASGHNFLEEINEKNGTFKIELLLMCIIAPVISQIGFSKLVKFLYPIFGLLGIWQIYNIFSYKIEGKKLLKKTDKTDITYL